jgi:uncharacterized membrane protein YgcG
MLPFWKFFCSRRAALVCQCLAGAVLLLALPSRARELRIERFEAEILVAPDARVDVTETIHVDFIGSWHGLYRTIPVEYVTPQGMNYSLFLDVERITDESGAALKYESSREGHYRKLKIYVPGAEDARKTIVIEYRVPNALRFWDNYDELYWNVTGDEWDVPIEDATARVILPEGTTGIRANAYTGAYGSTASDADTEVAGNGVDVRLRRPLGYHQGLTVAVAWDKGFVRQPSKFGQAMLFLRSNWPFLFPLAAVAVMFWLWDTRGRDPRAGPIAVQYAPPEGLTPGEAGTLVDNSANMRDITASIVDLAVRGFLRIEETKSEHMMGLWSDKDYTFSLLKPRQEWSSLKEHERDLLDGLFPGGVQAMNLSDLHNRFYTVLPSIRSDLFNSLVLRGYYRRRPDSVRQAWISRGVMLGVILAWGGVSLGAHLGMPPLPFILAAIMSGAVVCGFGWFMTAHTASGADALVHVLGFEDFLNHVEADRFNRTDKTPEMFEKFLPYAMAFGVEKNWSKAFQGLYTQPPQWYRGSYGSVFVPMLLVNNLSVMSAHTSSVLTSAPRSSGGSGFGGGGFGGGGFSGGGFGGGGGGGF